MTLPYHITPRTGGHFNANGLWDFTRFNVAFHQDGQAVWMHFAGGLAQAYFFDNEMARLLRGGEPFTRELVSRVGRRAEQYWSS
jgi:hypothetical protein